MSEGNSPEVVSNQTGPHPRLKEVVQRHREHVFRKDISSHTREAFEEASDFIAGTNAPICLDSFCGTGLSTGLLAKANPDHSYLGIDQSQARLERHGELQAPNYRLLRAEAGDFWRLAWAAGWCLHRHWLLYPNPWPKSEHLQRRVHGSSLFPYIIKLGGKLECRSNWRLYCEELSQALALYGYAAEVEELPAGEAISLFEAKFKASGHALWVCRADLDGQAQ